MFQCFTHLHYCLLSNLPQPCYGGIGAPPCPLGSPEQTSGLAKKGRRFQGHFQNISIAQACTPLFLHPVSQADFLCLIIIITGTRPRCAGVEQTQNGKDSPYLIDFMVDDLLCWALNRTYMLQGMEVFLYLFVGCWRSSTPDMEWLVKQVEKYRSSNFTFTSFTIRKIWLTESISVPWRGGVI